MAAGKALTLLATIPLKPECVDEYLVLVDEVNDRCVPRAGETTRAVLAEAGITEVAR